MELLSLTFDVRYNFLSPYKAQSYLTLMRQVRWLYTGMKQAHAGTDVKCKLLYDQAQVEIKMIL